MLGCGDLVVADRRGREGVVVVAEGVGADHRAVDAAVPALPDPAEPVDEVVVADVAPAAGLHVVGVDAAQERRHLGPRVVVGVDGVVHEAGVHVAVVQRRRVAHPLVGAPLGARVDHRRGVNTAAGSSRSRRWPAAGRPRDRRSRCRCRRPWWRCRAQRARWRSGWRAGLITASFMSAGRGSGWPPVPGPAPPLPDEQRVGAGPGVPGLGGARVGAVLGVVGDVASPTRCRRSGCGPRPDRVLGERRCRGPR